MGGILTAQVMSASSPSVPQAPQAPGLRVELLAMASDHDPEGREARGERLWTVVDDYEQGPGLTVVGHDGAEAAWLVAQSAIEDVGLQRRCLDLLEVAVACGDADPVHLAHLVDPARIND